MKLWFSRKLAIWSEWAMQQIADNTLHTDSVRKMARDAAFDIGTIRRIITPR